ncbi:MAG: ABC transporter permease, partial [Actinomycetota bacterium]|nr:ABC transporter permease [Actinomycetota bacterium]
MAVKETTAPSGLALEKQPRRRRGQRKGRFLGIYTGAVIAYLFLPIAVMIVFGFNDFGGKFNFVWRSFTLEHYQNLFELPDLTNAIKTSVIIAALASLIATVLGTCIALALTRYNFRARSGLNLFIFLPMATPEIILGVSLLGMFVTINFARGFWTILLAHIMFCVSYVVVTVKARTAGFDHNLEEAAQDLGANPWTTFWTVTFPLIFPGILAAAMLAFVLSLDDYVITEFVAGGELTFPRYVFGATRFGIPGQVNVFGTIIFLIGVIYVVVTLLRTRRADKTPPALPM